MIKYALNAEYIRICKKFNCKIRIIIGKECLEKMNIVTLNELNNIVETINDIIQKNCEKNELLSETLFNQYDIIEEKEKLKFLFAKFNASKYLYDFPVEDSITYNSSYGLQERFTQRLTVSKVENAVERDLDKKILATDIYNKILKLSYKLTVSEGDYLINTFIHHISEEKIAEIIGISKTYLQKIKKSCIIKMWVDLQIYCDK